MEASWIPFRSFLKENSPRQFKDLNGPCGEAKIAQAEKQLQQSIHPSLKALYRLNDGQEGLETGIFPSEATACRFLPVIPAAYLWESFKHSEDLDVFDPKLIPFAHDGIFDAYCQHSETGAVFFLQTGGPDPFLPRSWQTTKLEINSSLEAFLGEMLIRISNPSEYMLFMQKKALTGDTRDARVHGVDTIGRNKDPATTETLLTVLQNDPVSSVRFSAVLALGKIEGNAATNGLLKAIESDDDSGVRIESVRMLYKQKYANLARVIVTLLQKETDFWTRYEVTKILGKLAKRSPVSAGEVIPIITRDLNSMEDTNYMKFALAIALLRLEMPGGTAREVLEHLKNEGRLVDYQLVKLNKELAFRHDLSNSRH